MSDWDMRSETYICEAITADLTTEMYIGNRKETTPAKKNLNPI